MSKPPSSKLNRGSVSNPLTKELDRLKQRQYYRDHYDKHIAAVTRWKKANPDKVTNYERKRKRKKAGMANPTTERRYGTCPICVRSADLLWDHDHRTGQHRGWLCMQCNLSLGHHEKWYLIHKERIDNYLEAAYVQDPTIETKSGNVSNPLTPRG